MSTKPKQEALLLTDPPPSIGHTQALDFASVGQEGTKKKFWVLVDVLSGYSEVFRFLFPPDVSYHYPQAHGFLEFNGMVR